MTEIEFINHPKIVAILQGHQKVNIEKQQAGYNLFTISSYTYYLENFHSDIIYSMLNPLGLHNEGYAFLHLFISYLNSTLLLPVEMGNYLNVTVLREKGRLDVWIKDESSRHSIILENKINNASDREDQLLDYYKYAIGNEYYVDAIVYLSKDGFKTAPEQSKIMNTPVINIGAFMKNDSDLLHGWLRPCLQKASNEDSRSFLFQYCKLIAHISNNNMENDIKEAFYEYVSTNSANIQTIQNLKHLIITLPDYRAEKFGRLITEISPFKNRFLYRSNYWIFEKYEDGNGSYKLDVFFESNGNAKVVMWNTIKKENGGYETVKDILTRIDLISHFTGVSLYNGLTAEFNISEIYPTLEDVDKSVLSLVILVVKSLKTI